MRRAVVQTCMCLLLMLAMASASAVPGWVGRYYNGYNNTAVEPGVAALGTPALTRVDSTIDFNWGSGSPGAGVGSDYFLVKWTGVLRVSSGGNYVLGFQSDDGIRAYLGGQLIVDQWAIRSFSATPNTSPTLALTAGVDYPITVYFFEWGNVNQVKVSWKLSSDTSFTVIPANEFHGVSTGDDVSFRFEESAVSSGSTVNDSGRLGLTATVSGNPVSQTTGGPGCHNRSLLLDGSQYLSVPTNPMFAPNGAFSIAFWAKPTGGSGSWRTVVMDRFGEDGVAFGYNIYLSAANTWEFWTGNTSGYDRLSSPASATLNVWTHVVATFQPISYKYLGYLRSGTTIVYKRFVGIGRLYLDGVLVNTLPNMVYSVNTNPSHTFAIGTAGTDWNGGPGAAATFLGGLDELIFSSRLLTDQEIKTLATKTCPGGVGQADTVTTNFWGRAGSISGSDNTSVTSWTNESVSGGDVTQASSGPTLRTANAQTLNFNPILNFSGSNFLSNTGVIRNPSDSYANVFAVTSLNSTSGSTMLMMEGVNNFKFGLSSAQGGMIGAVGGSLASPAADTVVAPAQTSASLLGLYRNNDASNNFGWRRNGVALSAATSTQPVIYPGFNTGFYIGKDSNTGSGYGNWQGKLAEAIVYLGSPLSATAVQQIESYLAMKYGLTLGAPGSVAYLNSDGSSVWPAGSGFHNNVTALARDDISKLDQRISKSSNAGSQLSLVTGSSYPSAVSVVTPTSGTAFAADKSFVVVGDNAGDLSSWTQITTGSGVKLVSDRVWRLQTNVATSQTVSICVPDSLIPPMFFANGGVSDLQYFVATTSTFANANIIATGVPTAASCWVENGTTVSGRRFSIDTATVVSSGSGVVYFSLARSVPPLDHLEITGNNGATCDTTPLTIKACANSTCSSSYIGGVSGSITLAGTSYPFNIATGNVSTSVSTTVSTGGTYTIVMDSVSQMASYPRPFCGFGVPAAYGNSCTIQIDSSALLLDVDGATLIPNNAAYSTLDGTVKAVKSASGGSGSGNQCLPALSGVTAVKVYCQYVNPSSGTRPVLLKGSDAAYTSVSCQGPGSTTNVNMNFSASTGIAPFSIRYLDAGQITVGLSASAQPTNVNLAVSSSYVSAPSSFVISGLPASKQAAGDAFGYTVTVAGFGSNATLPNFGQETTPTAPTMNTVRIAPTQAGAQAGNVNWGAQGAYSGGVAAVTGASWDEVGTLVPVASLNSYLGTAFGAAGQVGATGSNWQACANDGASCNIPAGLTAAVLYGAAATGRVVVKTGLSGSVACSSATFGFDPAPGQSKSCAYFPVAGVAAWPLATSPLSVGFKPKRFDVTVTQGCNVAASSGFTYSGQAFGVLVSAKNSLNGVTANYDPAYSLASAIDLSVDATAQGLGSLLNSSWPASSFSGGSASRSAGSTSPTYTFTNALTAPVSAGLVATENGGDGVTTTTAASVKVRSGRLMMFNAFGTEKANLQVPIRTEYWGTQGWLPNQDDTCTGGVLTANQVAMTSMNPDGSAASWSTSVTGISFANGTGTLTLAAPTPALKGSVDLAINLGSSALDASCNALHPNSTGANAPWLRTRRACAVTLGDPAARATFGIYSPQSKTLMHIRDQF